MTGQAERDAMRLIGQRMRLAREEMRLSQGQLAVALGIERQTVQAWEKGKNMISAPQLARVAVELGRPLGFFDMAPVTANPLLNYTLEEILAFALGRAKLNADLTAPTNYRVPPEKFIDVDEDEQNGYSNHQTTGHLSEWMADAALVS